MKIAAAALAFAAASALAACGQRSEAENTAAALENAAEQSTPEAAAVLRNEAENIAEQNVTAPISEPGSPGQKALEKAGQAQAKAAAGADTAKAGAKPHAKGDPVPPPQVQVSPPPEKVDHNGH